MKKIVLPAILLTFSTLITKAQFVVKTYGNPSFSQEYTSDAKSTNDGGYILTGVSGNKISLVKLTANGDTSWTKIFSTGITTGQGTGSAVIQTTDGGYLITGTCTGGMFLLKTNSIGAVAWAKTYDSGIGSGGQDVLQTNDGGYMVAGTSTGTNENIYLVKTNSSGDTAWTRTYDMGDVESSVNISQTGDGGYILLGSYKFSPDTRFMLIKLDAAGNIGWAKRADATVKGLSMMINTAKEIVLTGTDQVETCLIKFDSTGNVLTGKKYDVGTMSSELPYAVAPTSDGGVILTGSTRVSSSNTGTFFIKADATGNASWAMCYGNLGSDHDKAIYIKENTDGSFTVIGETDITTSGDLEHFFAIINAQGKPACHATTFIVNSTTNYTPTVVSLTPAAVPYSSVVTSFTPTAAAGMMYDTICTEVGIKGVPAKTDAIIYPNPSDGSFNLSFGAEKPSTGIVQVTNMLGVVVQQHKVSIHGGHNTIKIQGLQQGVYFVSLNGNEYQTKLVVR